MDVIDAKNTPAPAEPVIVDMLTDEEREANRLKTQEGLVRKQVQDYLAAGDEKTKDEILGQFPKLKDDILAQVGLLVKDETKIGADKISQLEAKIAELERQRLASEQEKQDQELKAELQKAKETVVEFVAKNGYDSTQFATAYGEKINKVVNDLVAIGNSYQHATEVALQTVVKPRVDVLSPFDGDPNSPPTKKVEIGDAYKTFLASKGITI